MSNTGSNTKRFFHDRFILFTLTINAFIAILSSIIILFRLGGGDDSYIHYFRSNLGLSAISVGGVSEILAFVIFIVGVFVGSIFMALEFHKIRKSSAWSVMLLTTFLLIMSTIVANALLDLR